MAFLFLGFMCVDLQTMEHFQLCSSEGFSVLSWCQCMEQRKVAQIAEHWHFDLSNLM